MPDWITNAKLYQGSWTALENSNRIHGKIQGSQIKTPEEWNQPDKTKWGKKKMYTVKTSNAASEK